MAKLELSFHQQQARALNAPAEEILFGGAAGGGKSHLLRAALITFCLVCPGIQCYLFRRTFPELVRNHLNGEGSFHGLLAPLVIAGKAAVVGMEVRFYNGSRIHLRHLQHTKDIYTYQGTEIHVLAFDEATHFLDEEYRYLRGRCRLGGWKPPPHCKWMFPRILMGANPGGVGHVWVKEGWVNLGPFFVKRAPKEEGGMRRVYIPSRIEDNPTLLENDPDYGDRLEGLGDPMLVRAMKEGDWDVVAGAMFGEVWRKHLHVCEPFPIPVDWDVWIGADDGYSPDPFWAVWLTQDPRTKTIYVIDETHGTNWLPRKVAQEVIDVNGQIERWYGPGKLIQLHEGRPQGLLDSAAFGDGHGQSEIARGPQMQNEGLGFEPVDKWPGSKAHRAQNLHKLLAPNPRDPKGLPGIRFFRGKTDQLTKILPILPRDDKHPDQVGDHPFDHAYDALTYGCQWVKSEVKRVRVRGT